MQHIHLPVYTPINNTLCFNTNQNLQVQTPNFMPNMENPSPTPSQNPSSPVLIPNISTSLISSSTYVLKLKSEDPSLDQEILNLKLERLRLLEQVREMEMQNSKIEPYVEGGEKSKAEEIIISDEELAKKLLAEELELVKKSAKTKDQVSDDFSQQIEALFHDPKITQDLSQLEKDEQFARFIEKQYSQNTKVQINEDELLARRLEAQEKLYSPITNIQPPKPKKKITPPKPTVGYLSMNKTTPELRKHAVDVHSRFCPCKNTSAGYNGHLFKVHDENCSCTKLHVKY